MRKLSKYFQLVQVKTYLSNVKQNFIFFCILSLSRSGVVNVKQERNKIENRK